MAFDHEQTTKLSQKNQKIIYYKWTMFEENALLHQLGVKSHTCGFNATMFVGFLDGLEPNLIEC